ncbi:MAG: alpha-glucosidase [Bifidobacteriaceae bacterium]|jgi:oligo-1,6-glucosidase|nr:alpha-glucosidase [Bifidobacteriaceae bacterium]
MTEPVAGAAPEWWRQATVYQIWPRSFADGDGDGVGDLAGVIGHLGYLAELGVDALWLSPFYPSPGADMGYDISDYQDVDPLFGDLATFDALVAGAHRRRLRVIVDIVANHTSDEHPWFLESRSSRAAAKRDWYWWRPPRPGFQGGEPGAEPNNWQSFFGGPTWTYDGASGEYYLHLFDRKQPDLNWENPAVREALFGMMRWWRDRGVDGLRLDVVNLISKDPALPDGEGGDGFPFYANGPRIHEFLRELRAAVAPAGNPGGFALIGEMPGISAEQAVAYTDPERRELDMVFPFDHMDLDHGAGKFDVLELAPGALADRLADWQERLGRTGWVGLYLSNHDQPRPASRFGDGSPAAAKALGLAMHLQRGTAFCYQGEEIGMVNPGFTDVGELRDVESLRHLEAGGSLAGVAAMGRDNARLPMQPKSRRC